jgi:hypothetical protein
MIVDWSTEVEWQAYAHASGVRGERLVDGSKWLAWWMARMLKLRKLSVVLVHC